MTSQDSFWNNQTTVEEFYNKPCSSYITDEIENISKLTTIHSAIDIGCGGGRYSRFLSQKGYDVLAVDKNTAMVEKVKHDNINCLQCDMSNILAESSTFDLVLCIGVLHNAIDREELSKSVQEISRILKKGKYAIISIFTSKIISDDLIKIDEFVYKLKNDKPPMTLLNEQQIISLFQENNLVLIKKIDEHQTDVGTGVRNVLSLSFRKE